MKISKAMFAVIAGAAIATAAHGEDAVQAKKEAPIQKLLPDAYGSVEVRHSTLQERDGDKVVNTVPSLQVRPTIGTALFDGAVDTAFTLRYKKSPDSTRVKKSSTYNETYVNIIGNDAAKIQAYALTYLAGENSFSESDIGLSADAAKSFDIVGGSLKLSTYINPTAALNSGKNAADPDNKVQPADKTGGLSLTDSQTTVEQRDPSIWNYYGVGAKYSLSAVSGLTFGTGVDVGQLWQPKYANKEVDGDVRLTQDGYKTRTTTSPYVNASYKLTDKTSIKTTLRGLTDGYFAESISAANPDETMGYGSNRYEARVSLNATLF